VVLQVMFRWLFFPLRAGGWAKARREHLLKEPECVACGKADAVNVHHIVPYHTDPKRELDPTNLVTLCADPCHLVHGHLMSWSRANPEVREDCARYRAKLEKAKHAV
jgi:5-methylcytosine-specific restriction endonuclease McrA